VTQRSQSKKDDFQIKLVQSHSSLNKQRSSSTIMQRRDKCHIPREPDESGSSALTNTPIPLLGGLYPAKVQKKPVETF